VTLIFLQRKSTLRYEEKMLDDFIELVKGSHLVGISTMTNYFDNAVQLTRKIKEKMNVPVIWGGIHATIRPVECLDYADMVCIGEAEESIVELAKKMEEGRDIFDTRGIWFKRDGKIVENGLNKLVQNLDEVPFQDYDWKTHYISGGNSIREMDELQMKYLLNEEYMAQPTRGCPFACAYCCNDTFLKLYPEQRPHFRKRSIPNVMQELKEVKRNLPFIRKILFNDDAFFLYSDEEIKEFSEEYKNHIGLPLSIAGATPTTLTEKKLSTLIDAGLTDIRMGIQSESPRVKKLYKRNYSTGKTLEAVNLIHKYGHKIPLPRYDIILNNPWETDDDLILTLMFLSEIPVPHELNIFSLNLYPGTELYDKAKAEGIVKDDLQDVYRNSYNVRADGLTGKLANESYLNNLFYLLYVYGINGIQISRSKMKILTDYRVTPVRSRILYTFMRFKAGLLLKKGLMKKAMSANKDREKFERQLQRSDFLD
jgi:anaerobic magnesium-protoporphyrin IX monomethyl ester cyclase